MPSCFFRFQVLEVAFISASQLLFGPREDPSKAVASRRLLPALLLGVLRKLTGMGGAEDKLLQPLGRACLSVAGTFVRTRALCAVCVLWPKSNRQTNIISAD